MVPTAVTGLAAIMLVGCYAGVAPTAGVSLENRQLVLGWEVTCRGGGGDMDEPVGSLGITAGRSMRRAEEWKKTTWGALNIEVPFAGEIEERSGLVRFVVGAGGGGDRGSLIGIGAGAGLPLSGGRCEKPMFDATLWIRLMGGSLQMLVAPRIGYFTAPCGDGGGG